MHCLRLKEVYFYGIINCRGHTNRVCDFFKYKFVGSPSTVNFIRIYYSIIFEFVIQLTMKSMKISPPQNIMKSTPKRQSQITCH